MLRVPDEGAMNGQGTQLAHAEDLQASASRLRIGQDAGLQRLAKGPR